MGVDRIRPAAGGAIGEDKAGREYLSEECKRWKGEIYRLWDEVENISGKRMPGGQEGDRQNGHALRSRRGSVYSVREAKARPSNTAARELMGSEANTEAVLYFPRGTDQGMVKARGLDTAG